MKVYFGLPDYFQKFFFYFFIFEDLNVPSFLSEDKGKRGQVIKIFGFVKKKESKINLFS